MEQETSVTNYIERLIESVGKQDAEFKYTVGGRQTATSRHNNAGYIPRDVRNLRGSIAGGVFTIPTNNFQISLSGNFAASRAIHTWVSR